MSNSPMKYIQRWIAEIKIPLVNNFGCNKQRYSGRNLGAPCKYLVRYLLTLHVGYQIN